MLNDRSSAKALFWAGCSVIIFVAGKVNYGGECYKKEDGSERNLDGYISFWLYQDSRVYLERWRKLFAEYFIAINTCLAISQSFAIALTAGLKCTLWLTGSLMLHYELNLSLNAF